MFTAGTLALLLCLPSPQTHREVAVWESPTPTRDARFGRRVALERDLCAIADRDRVTVLDRAGVVRAVIDPLHDVETLMLTRDRLVVGMPEANGTGAVAIHRASASGWELEQTLLAPPFPTPSLRRFGFRLAIAGELLLVADPMPGELAIPDGPGRVFVFARIAGAWSLVDELAAPVPGIGFGSILAADGERLAVGAFGTGLWILERGRGGPGHWGPVGHVPALGASFGGAVELDGDLLIVGQPSFSFGRRGRAFLFERDAGGEGAWGLAAELSPATTPQLTYGITVAVENGQAFVGDPRDLLVGTPLAGRVHVYARRADGRQPWSEVARLTPVDSHVGDDFGAHLDVEGRVLLVGAPGRDGPAGSSGAAVELRAVRGLRAHADPRRSGR